MGNQEVHEEKRQLQNTWGIFNGKIEAFSQFYANFTTAINAEKDLSEDEKCDLLLQACQNEAKNLVANLSFEQALKRLGNIYGSAYRQMQYHTRKLLNIKPVTVASAGNLQAFYNEICQCQIEIKKCVHENESDHMVTFVVIEKLYKETTRVWERHRLSLAESWADTDEASNEIRGKKDYLPSFDTFIKCFFKVKLTCYWVKKANYATKQINTKRAVFTLKRKNEHHFFSNVNCAISFIPSTSVRYSKRWIWERKKNT